MLSATFTYRALCLLQDIETEDQRTKIIWAQRTLVSFCVSSNVSV